MIFLAHLLIGLAAWTVLVALPVALVVGYFLRRLDELGQIPVGPPDSPDSPS